MTNLDNILKSRHITLPKGLSNQGYGFSSSHVWMWELAHKDGWAPKNWCFELLCWRRLLRFPWTARRSNQSILKEISLEYSWKDWYRSWNANTLATSYEELTHWKRPWCWDRWKAGGEGDDWGWDGWMASLTQWTWVSNLWELVMDMEASRAAVHGVTKSWTWKSDWTELRVFTSRKRFWKKFKCEIKIISEK